MTTISYEEFDCWELGKKSDYVDLNKIAKHLNGQVKNGKIIIDYNERRLELLFQFFCRSDDNNLAFFIVTLKNMADNKDMASFSYLEPKNPLAKIVLRHQYIKDDNLIQLPTLENRNYITKREQIITATPFITIETPQNSISIWPDASFNIAHPPKSHRW